MHWIWLIIQISHQKNTLDKSCTVGQHEDRSSIWPRSINEWNPFSDCLWKLCEEFVQRSCWWWFKMHGIILWYSWGFSALIVNGILSSQISMIVMFGTQPGNEAKFIQNRLPHPSSRKKSDLITSNFAFLIIQSKILVLGVINILYEQWTRMRQLMIRPLPLLKQCFITSLSGIGITLMLIHLLVNKSTRHLWRIRNYEGTITNIMIRQTLIYFWHCTDKGNGRQGWLISSHMMTLGMTQIFTSVWLICDEEFSFLPIYISKRKKCWRIKTLRRGLKRFIELVWFHIAWHQE